MLNAPRRRTAADEAERALFQGIMNRSIPPGAPLRLQDLADQLDMSMMPIREAIRRLEGLGLVEVVAHKGAWVRPLSLADLHDTYFTRIHHESLALSLAAQRFGEEASARATLALEALDEAVGHGDPLASRDAHEAFHFAMYEASGSTWLVHSIWPVWRNSERYRVESMRNAEHARLRAAEHKGMLAALQAGDGPSAVRLLVSHLESSARLVASELEETADDARLVADLPSVEDLLGPVGASSVP